MANFKRNKFNLHIRLKILLVIVVTILFSIGVNQINRHIIKKHVLLTEKAQQNEYKQLVRALLEVRTEIIQKTSFDYSCYDWMTEFIANPDTMEAKQYISPPEFLGIDLFQVYNLKREKIFFEKSSTHYNLDFQPESDFFNLIHKKKYMTFFGAKENDLIQFVATTIHKTRDTSKLEEPYGYLILAKVYDKNYVKKMEQSMNCKLQTYFAQNSNPLPDNMDIVFNSYDNKIIGGLSIIKNSAVLTTIKSLNNKLEWIFIFSLLVICIITIVAYDIIVLRPIRIIQAALNNHSDKTARKLMYKRDEFGKIARLIVRFFEQRKLLDDKLNKISHTKTELKKLNDELTTTANNLRIANDEIRFQQKNTNDNIYYASVVQKAALIPSFNINDVFKEHFIIFEPRDIISGDFYWFQAHKGRYFIASADCTGHGLSGSLLSMLGISFLNQIIHQSADEINSAEMLEKLRSFLVDSLHQQGETIEVHDGIDIGLGIFDLNNMTMDYAAAYNPLFIIRKNPDTGEFDLKIYKGDSMPAGVYEVKNNFSNHKIKLEHGDLLYLYTDGFVDQFGGPDNKKYLTKRFKDLLLSVAPQSLNTQKEILLQEFKKWKGNNFQVDDITIIGLKIP